MFRPDAAVLIDPAAAIRNLKPCAQLAAGGNYLIDIRGHTSLDTSGLSAGLVLSQKRADVIRDLLHDHFGIPAWAFHKVDGVGPKEPVRRPATDPHNRTVVVTFRPIR
jgi:outer membrane protein OmpA-like peptidoglycan-associated protein